MPLETEQVTQFNDPLADHTRLCLDDKFPNWSFLHVWNEDTGIQRVAISRPAAVVNKHDIIFVTVYPPCGPFPYQYTVDKIEYCV